MKLLLLKSRTRSETNDAAVRILKSLFPPLILELYKLLIAPLAQGKIAALMVARVTVITCQWLMGPCKVNTIELPNGESWESGVFVEKCQYLEESKCVGVCINTCKLPTQTFFKDYMGVPLLMEPDFKDYSCQVLLAFLSNHTCLTPKLTMLMVNWFLSKLACWVLRMFLCRVNKPSLIPL